MSERDVDMHTHDRIFPSRRTYARPFACGRWLREIQTPRVPSSLSKKHTRAMTSSPTHTLTGMTDITEPIHTAHTTGVRGRGRGGEEAGGGGGAHIIFALL